MQIQQREKLLRPLSTVVLWLGVVVIIVALACLMGWIFHVDVLTRVIAGRPTMKFNTAVCFVLMGSALVIARRRPPKLAANPRRTNAARCLAGSVIAIAALSLSQYLFDWSAGIDQLLFTAPVTDLATPGRMAAATAIIFMLLSAALLSQLGRAKASSIAFGQTLAAVALFGSMVVFLGHLFGAETERLMLFSSVAVATAFNFVVASVGALMMRGHRGWMSVFFQQTASARIARRYLLGVLLILPLLSWMAVMGQRNLRWYGSYFGTALLATISMLVLCVLLWASTRKYNFSDHKMEKLQRMNGTLSGINGLIVRVRTQDELFNEACRVAGEVGGLPWVWVGTFHDNGGEMQTRINAHWVAAGSAVESLQKQLTEPQSIAALMHHLQRTGTPIVVADLLRDSDADKVGKAHKEHLLAAGIRSLAALPFNVGGKVVGACVLSGQVVGLFDDAEMRVLRELAGDISFAINHLDKESRLDSLSNFDPLTGLPNRTLFLERLDRELHRAGRDSQEMVVGIVDVRRLRAINESMGRQAGDELLVQLAKRMKQAMLFPENLARLGGDGFASFATGESAGPVARRVQQLARVILDEPFVVEGQSLKVTLKLGVALFPHDGTDGETLLLNAETALRQAQASTELIKLFEPQMNARVVAAMRLEHKLHRAFENGEFILHYQPKMGFGSQRVGAVEALMRWNDPETGRVSAADFIPSMEESGLILRAGAWALKQAVADIGRWREMGLEPPRVSVNVSAMQLRSQSFLRDVEAAMTEFAGAAPLLDIEVTESMLMADIKQSVTLLKCIRDMQVNIAVDDFGTGYSSLAYLAELPIDALKIDRRFVVAMESDGAGRAIVASIISLAHALRLQVIAEGVETQAQADQLMSLGCDLMQGYLFSRPVSFDDLAHLLPVAGSGQSATATVPTAPA